MTDFQKSELVVENARPAAEKLEALVVEKKKPLSMEVRRFCESELVATTPPCALVESSAFVTPVRTKFVVVAVPETVRPPVTEPFPIVVDAWKIFKPVKVFAE